VYYSTGGATKRLNLLNGNATTASSHNHQNHHLSGNRITEEEIVVERDAEYPADQLYLQSFVSTLWTIECIQPCLLMETAQSRMNISKYK
jgi:hypothetical protein